MNGGPCSVDGCDKVATHRGWCGMHYARWQRHGSLAKPSRRRPTEDRFWPKVNKDGPLPSWAPFLGSCWIWTAATEQHGYGQIFDGDRVVPAHRWSYEHHIGPIPDGLVLDHLCRVPGCVRPEHLEPVTHAENVSRGITGFESRKTHCVHGHPLSGDNLSYKAGRRRCLTCHRDGERRRKLRRQAAAA